MTKTTYKMKPVAKKSYDNLPRLREEDLEPTVLMQTLYRALSVKRPSGSVEEAQFAAWMAINFGATLIDEAGNIHFDRRTNGERTLFTSHTDTVHHRGGVNTILVDGNLWRAQGDVLGADDGAGVALIAHMLASGVGGYFCLFRGEECGGIGSKWLADNMPYLLEEFDRAIAFDRAGQYDVITHQACSRCCSDAFATALADQLVNDDMSLVFMPSDAGVYTDTAEFTAIIPECTNLSVGYYRQHSDEETQDIEFLKTLAERLPKIDWESLPTSRDPKEVDDSWKTGWAKYWYFGTTKSYAIGQVKSVAANEQSDTGAYYGLEADEKYLYDAISGSIVDGKDDELLRYIAGFVGYFVEFSVEDNLDAFDECLTKLAQGSSAADVVSDLMEMIK